MATSIGPIKHVIVLMFENRSFEQILGYRTFDPRSAVCLLDHEAARYCQSAGAARTLNPDPGHDVQNVLHQIRNNNSGFVTDYEDSAGRPNAAQRAEVMKFFGPDELPVTHALVDAFTVCDQWFSSVPGPTWPNRFFVHSGTSLGRVSMPHGPFNPNLHWYDQDTIFDRLNDHDISWKIYYGDWPQSLLLTHQLLIPTNAARYAHMDDFFADASGAEQNFPFYSFIEPTYFGTEANDYHPGSNEDVFSGEALLASVYNQIRNNQPIWEARLLIVLFEEPGGVFDPDQPA